MFFHVHVFCTIFWRRRNPFSVRIYIYIILYNACRQHGFMLKGSKVSLILHLKVSQVSLAKRASPQFEYCVQIFTSHLPMMDQQDQVTLTNWPASKKNEVKNLLDVPGFVPAYEKQRAPLRLMSWCTYSVPDDLRQTLYRLSILSAKDTTIPALLLEEANRIGLQAQSEDQVKQHLIRRLICHANGRKLTNYHGVVGSFLHGLPLAMVVYMLDYYLHKHCLMTTVLQRTLGY